jgi:hypothetical protein
MFYRKTKKIIGIFYHELRPTIYILLQRYWVVILAQKILFEGAIYVLCRSVIVAL